MDKKNGSRLAVFPNPARDILHIENYSVSGPVYGAIFDMSGKGVCHFSRDHTSIERMDQSVNVLSLSAGIYTLVINQHRYNVQHKLIIVK